MPKYIYAYDPIEQIKQQAKAEERRRIVEWIKSKSIKCAYHGLEEGRIDYTLTDESLAELEKGDDLT